MESQSQDWEKMQQSLWKGGYRDGIDQGRNLWLQKYFDVFYQLCFNYYKRLGILKGLIMSQAISLHEATVPQNLQPLLTELTDEEEAVLNHNLPGSEMFEETVSKLEAEWDNVINRSTSKILDLCPALNAEIVCNQLRDLHK